MRRNCSEAVAELCVALDRLRLNNIEAQPHRRFFDGRNGEFHSASARTIGLSHDERDGVADFRKQFQRGDGESRSAAENQIHKGRRVVAAIIVNRLPLSRFHELFDLAFYEVALDSADVGDVELAVKMIGFVQKGAGQKFFTRVLEGLAV